MKREVYSRRLIQTTLNVTQGKIDSVRKKDITRSACRVYENGKIGVSGFFGEPTEENWKAAQENLSLGIPYEYKTESGRHRAEDRRKEILSEKEFLSKSEEMMKRLQKENPDFIFSNKLMSTDVTQTLKNDEGLFYENADREYIFSLIFKHRDSKAVFDGGIAMSSRSFDAERFVQDAGRMLRAYCNEVPMPEEKVLPVVCSFYDIGPKIMESLDCSELGKKTSIFSDKFGTKAFNENFSIYVDRTAENIGAPFFDAEGSVLKDDRIVLIENGVIRNGFCDKKNAAEFGFANTASAEGAIDDVPELGCPGAEVMPSNRTFKELVGSGKAIYIDTMAGGDCTAAGDFASPVQLAYLIENGELVGRLPEFKLSGNIYEMFGDDFIGQSSDKPFFDQHVLCVKMHLD